MQTMTISPRFRGPPNSGNGGYVCGMLARYIAGAAEVTLRAPPPLELELSVVPVAAGLWELRQGTTIIAIGRAMTLDMSRLHRATYAEAVEAEKRTIKPHEHLLPMCFVSGIGRRSAHLRRAARPAGGRRGIRCTLDTGPLPRRS
jgi:hypothetical protein